MGFNPAQRRDAHGRWIRGMGGVQITTKPPTPFRRRGSGLSGLRRNTVPYVRVNKRSGTAGINTGTLIPGTSKRIAIGGYARLETTRSKTAVDRFVDKGINKVFPKGTRGSKTVSYLRKNVKITNPAVRANFPGVQARVGTSRRAGATVIIRRGKHKTSWDKSFKGVQKYDRRMATIAGERAKKGKRSRPQRRRAARKKKA